MSIASPKPTPAPQQVEAAIGSLTPGAVVAERYRVLSLLGEGGMGAVYRVEHVHMRKAFALKVLHGAASQSPEIVARFEREAITAGNIAHPNVVSATDFGKLPDGSFFLVLELVEGRTLRRELELGALVPERAVRIMYGVVGAVAAAHAKEIVHRDLKPENVMLVQRDGDDDFVKVLDFGIAKVGTDATSRDSGVQALTRFGTIMGTPDYMSPEMALGQPVDARSDLYALGVIFFELLTGACPFLGSAVAVLRQHVTEAPPSLPADVVAKLPSRMPEVIARLLAKEPGARFQTAVELLAALDEATAIVSTAAAQAAIPESVERPAEPALSNLGKLARQFATRVTSLLPPSVKPYVTERRLAVVGVATFSFCIAVVLVVSISMGRSEPAAVAVSKPSAPAPSASDVPSASVTAPPTSPPEVTEIGPDDSAVVPAVQPSAVPSAAKGGAPTSGAPRGPASRPSRTRRTGPGGIYIPPPKDWFK